VPLDPRNAFAATRFFNHPAIVGHRNRGPAGPTGASGPRAPKTTLPLSTFPSGQRSRQASSPPKFTLVGELMHGFPSSMQRRRIRTWWPRAHFPQQHLAAHRECNEPRGNRARAPGTVGVQQAAQVFARGSNRCAECARLSSRGAWVGGDRPRGRAATRAGSGCTRIAVIVLPHNMGPVRPAAHATSNFGPSPPPPLGHLSD